MSSDLTPYFGNTILRWLAGQAAMPSSPSGLYLALFNGNPKTSGTEVGATINSSTPRQSITFAALAAGAAHLLTSSNAQDWGLSAGATTLSHIALFDNATPGSGHMYASKAVSGGPQAILVNSAVKFNTAATTFNIGSDT
jgi:hypothetical protein